MDKERLISDVRHLLDEQELVSEIDFTEEDALPIDARIESVFAGAYNSVMMMLPLRVVPRKEMEDAIIHADVQLGTGRVELPSDFLRLVEFRMKGWKRSASILINEADEAYLLQHNHAMRGGVVSPCVALVGGGTELEYFSLPRWYKEHEVERFSYVAEAKDIKTTEITEQSYEAVVLMTARDTAMSMGKDVKGIEERLKIELRIE